MNETLRVSMLLGVILMIGLFTAYYFAHEPIHPGQSHKSGEYVPLPAIEAPEGYGADFKTYHSELGFSFEYPPHLKVIVDPNSKGRRIILVSTDKEEDAGAIVISGASNHAHITAEEWLLGPMSGFSTTSAYFKIKIDDQDAVNTDGGMWTVVNNPDATLRLSIADLTTGSSSRPFTEMGIIIESLKFD